MRNTRKMLLSAILSEANKAEDPVEYLKEVNEPSLKILLWYAFQPRLKFALPTGNAPFKTTEHPDGVDLRSELRRFPIFLQPDCEIEGIQKYPNLKQPRREQLFIQMLESLHPDEAKLVIAVKDKKLPYKSLTKKVIKEAYPEIPLE